MSFHKPGLVQRVDVYDSSDVSLQVSRDAFRQFNRWMNVRLEELVARWAHAAGPNATRTAETRFSGPKPE